MSQLNFSFRLTAYQDVPQGATPQRQHYNWGRNLYSVPGSAPKDGEYTLAVGETRRMFDGLRSTSIDNTTQFTLTISPLASDRYRFSWTGGTAPAFRTDRGLTCNGQTITTTVNINGTLTMSSSSAGAFAAVQVSDIIFIPGVSTGDAAGPFNDINTGYWIVLAKDGTNTTLQLTRPSDQDFLGIGETPVMTSNTALQAFSGAGVQISDRVAITAGFSIPVLQTYDTVAIHPRYFEVVATGPLPVAAVAAPGAAGIKFYTSAKRMIYVEANQKVSVRLNGDTNDFTIIDPWVPGDPERPGWWTASCAVWTLDLVNKSAAPATVFIATVD